MKKTLLLLLTAIMMMPFAVNAATYTVAGSAAILNGTASWVETNADNDMISEDDVNYTLTISGISVEAGTYEFKVVMDHNWNDGKNAWPSSNWKLTIEETAKYDIVYTFNAETKDITATATKVGEFEGSNDKTYTVAGSSAILGSEWGQTDTNNDMVKGDDGIYRLVKEHVALEAKTYEYKVVVNHDWGTAYPSSNAKLVIAEAGNYNVTFTFNETTKEVGATATAIVEVVDPTVYTIVGTFNNTAAGEDVALFGKSWDVTLEDNDMVKGEDGIYRLEKKGFLLEAGDYEFKVVADHKWDVSYPKDNVKFNVSETDSYNVTFTFNEETKEANVTVLKHFSIVFQTNAGWQDVYAYVWSGEGENEVLGKWPGTKMYYSQRYWWFEISFDAAIAPEYIIFNNGVEGEGNAKTQTFSFKNQETYQHFIDNPDIEPSYTVVGAFNGSDGDDPIFKKSWNVYIDDNTMVKGEDGIYTLTLKDVELTSSGSILYKVVKNHSWDSGSWGFPDKENGNADYYVGLPEGAEKATYDITFKFNPKENFGNGYQVDCKVAMKGDLNGDWKVDIADLVIIIHALSNGETNGLDVNGDGKVDVSDISAIINVMTN